MQPVFMDSFSSSTTIEFYTKRANHKKYLHYYTYDFMKIGMRKETIVVPRLRLGKNRLEHERWRMLTVEKYKFGKKTGFITLREFFRCRKNTDK